MAAEHHLGADGAPSALFILATYAFCARKNWIRMVSHETDKKHSPNGYRTRALSCAFLPAFLPLCVCVCVCVF